MRPIKIKIKTESEAYSIIIGSNIIKSLSRYLRNNQINFNKCILIIDKKIPLKSRTGFYNISFIKIFRSSIFHVSNCNLGINLKALL